MHYVNIPTLHGRIFILYIYFMLVLGGDGVWRCHSLYHCATNSYSYWSIIIDGKYSNVSYISFYMNWKHHMIQEPFENYNNELLYMYVNMIQFNIFLCVYVVTVQSKRINKSIVFGCWILGGWRLLSQKTIIKQISSITKICYVVHTQTHHRNSFCVVYTMEKI